MNTIKCYHWQIVASENDGYYSVTGVSVPELGDSEGFFTLDEIGEIGKVFNAMENPDLPRSVKSAKKVQDSIAEQALSASRWEEYKKHFK